MQTAPTYSNSGRQIMLQNRNCSPFPAVQGQLVLRTAPYFQQLRLLSGYYVGLRSRSSFLASRLHRDQQVLLCHPTVSILVHVSDLELSFRICGAKISTMLSLLFRKTVFQTKSCTLWSYVFGTFSIVSLMVEMSVNYVAGKLK